MDRGRLKTRLRLAALAVLTVALGGVVIHAGELENSAAYWQARKALADGLPGVAALDAERLLSQPGADWSEDEAKTLATLAVEGWMRGGRPDEVLRLLEKGVKPHGSLFWRGQALLMKGDLDAAETVLRGFANAGRYSEWARLCLAQALMAQGRDVMARRELKELRQSGDAELARRARLMFNESELQLGRQKVVGERLSREADQSNPEVVYLSARAAFQAGRLEEAAAKIQELLKGSAGGARLHHAAALLEAEILLAMNRPAAAQTALLRFIDKTLNGEFQHEAFNLLRRAREAFAPEEDNPLPPEVPGWIASENKPGRQADALFLAALWLAEKNRKVEALGLLESLLAVHAGHRLESEAMRKVMEIQGSLGHDERVLALAESWRSRHGGGDASVVDLITGSMFYGRGDYREALARFQRAVDLATALGERRRALFNAAMAAIKAGETALYASLLGQLQAVGVSEAQGAPSVAAGSGSGETAFDLELDHALEMAAQGRPGAREELQRLTQAQSGHPRLVEARLAMAELALLDKPPRVQDAEGALDACETALAAQEAGDLRQRVAYTRIWCRKAEGDWPGVTKSGLAFLKAWPASSLAAEVQMQVADSYFRQEDFANAQTQYELVAKNHPQSDFAETALFMAGRAAINLRNVDAAIGHWESLAIQEGELSRVARIQQALAKRRVGDEQDALKVVDGLLAEKGLDSQTRLMLQLEKAELLIQLGITEPKQLAAAVAVLEGLLKDKQVSGVWRARAGYWMAYALRRQKQDVAALAACRDVVEQPELAQRLDPETGTWYYRAGFLAVELLEEMKQWEGAARMAEQLAQAGGDRAEEAKDVATKIRLERFLWDERK